jgi:hypothetical protein
LKAEELVSGVQAAQEETICREPRSKPRDAPVTPCSKATGTWSSLALIMNKSFVWTHSLYPILSTAIFGMIFFLPKRKWRMSL